MISVLVVRINSLHLVNLPSTCTYCCCGLC